MKSSVLLGVVPLVAVAATAANGNPKRGLCYVPDSDFPEDNKVWIQSGSDLTWYYNYGDTPSPAFADKTQEEFEFIPMMWGADLQNLNSTTFYDNVKELVDGGRNISRVMGFNEPDTTHEVGGSNIPPANAATAWVANFVPLQEMGIEVGLPAMTGAPTGLTWLQEFLGNCSELISTNGNTRNCTFDFLPVHWYDNYEGLMSHIGERLMHWPNTSVWITEYAYAHRELDETETFFNMTLNTFDEWSDIGGYSYFGAFRSAASNVGKDATFLNNAGDLSDMGAWYLGFEATGVSPDSGSVIVKVPSFLTISLGLTAMSLVFSL